MRRSRSGDSDSVNEDATLTVDASRRPRQRQDIDDDSLTADLVADVGHGSLSLDPDGGYTYTPAANYNGPDSFTYRAFDGSADSNTVTGQLTITAVNDPPSPSTDPYSTTKTRP